MPSTLHDVSTTCVQFLHRVTAEALHSLQDPCRRDGTTAGIAIDGKESSSVRESLPLHRSRSPLSDSHCKNLPYLRASDAVLPLAHLARLCPRSPTVSYACLPPPSSHCIHASPFLTQEFSYCYIRYRGGARRREKAQRNDAKKLSEVASDGDSLEGSHSAVVKTLKHTRTVLHVAWLNAAAPH